MAEYIHVGRMRADIDHGVILNGFKERIATMSLRHRTLYVQRILEYGCILEQLGLGVDLVRALEASHQVGDGPIAQIAALDNVLSGRYGARAVASPLSQSNSAAPRESISPAPEASPRILDESPPAAPSGTPQAIDSTTPPARPLGSLMKVT